MKTFTPMIGGAALPTLLRILLPFGLSVGIFTEAWSQASLNPTLPANSKICTGVNTTFTVAATGAGAITYQWQESTDGGINWNDLVENATTGANPSNGIYTGTASSVLTITRAPSTMNGNKYRANVYLNGLNGVTSNAATLNVGPDISLDNVPTTNCPGTSNTLNTAGAGGVSYQWQVSSNGGSSWTNITDGADAATGVTYSGSTSSLTINPLTTSVDGYLYRYTANDGAGCNITSGVTTQLVPALAVFTLPSISSLMVNVGSGISIPSTITSGTGPFHYQWQMAVGAGSFANISASNPAYSGVTTSTLTIPSVTSAMYNNRYRVIVRNAGNCVTASSLFAQIGSPSVLPVTIISFTAEKQGSSAVKLAWETGSVHPSSYTVQRSADGVAFTDLGNVDGEDGKTSYTFLDGAFTGGVAQYRLKMTDRDQEAVYSMIVQIAGEGSSTHIELRPSLTASPFTNLYTNLGKNTNIVLTVTDVVGRLQQMQSLRLGKGECYTPLDVSRLKKGIYYIQISSPDGLLKTLPFVRE